VKHLHDQGHCHKDIKIQNVFIHFSQIKLTDVGLTRKVTATMSNAFTAKGAALHMPPEMYETKPNFTEKSDVYSLGILLHELLTFEKPF
jgi:serine/threonine protein kinase